MAGRETGRANTPAGGYRVEVESAAAREFAGLAPEARRLLGAAIDDLAANPRPPGAKRLTGVNGWRIRKSAYRGLYTIDDAQRLIRIYRVGHRREVYRGI